MMSRIKPYLTPFNIFVAFVFAGFAGYLFYAVRYGAIITDWLMMENTDLSFCDFKMHVQFVADPANLYTRATFAAGCFPPLSYIMYYFFYRLLYRGGHMPYVYGDIEWYSYLYLEIVIYSIIVVMLLYFVISYWGVDKKKNLILFVALMMSVPFFAGAVSVANSTMLIMILMMFALKMRESESKAVREAALVIIAVCAGFKIYPAVFGLLYLLEKRYKEAIRLTVYGMVLFFVPFAFFGGVEGFMLWLGNVSMTMGMNSYGRIQCIKGLFVTADQFFGIGMPEVIIGVAPAVFLVLMIVLACITKSRYRRLFFLCAIMLFFPTNAYRYTLCYLSMPLILYFSEKHEKETDPFMYIEIVLYSLVYAIPFVLGKLMQFKLTFTYYTLTYVEGWAYAFAYILLITVIIHEIWSLKHAV